jgi:hypothetical protein
MCGCTESSIFSGACEPSIVLDNFTETMLNQTFACQIMHLEDSYMIWLGGGTAAPCMSNFAASMSSRFDPMPLTSEILKDGTDFSAGMAQRLCKRLGKPVFCSCHMKGVDNPDMLLAFAEAKIVKRLKPAA